MDHSTILQYLKQLSQGGVAPLHMPGHKRNGALAPYLDSLGAALDITEVHGSDCLHHPSGIIKNAMEKGAALWGVPHSYLLVNGSTCGILAGIHAATQYGDKVLMARSCHKSVYHGVALCGLEVNYLQQGQHAEGYCQPVTVQAVEEGLKAHPDTKLMVVTSPTYEGYLSDLNAIVEICHRNGTALMVDEAHGAHLGFSPYFTGSAVGAGADIVVQSLHKTMPSLTQTAIAHLQGTLVEERQFATSLSTFQSTSPSYLLMASMDGCLQLMIDQGEMLFLGWQMMLERFYRQVKGLRILFVVDEPPAVKDPSKIIISTIHANLDGTQLSERLWKEYKIEMEMAYGDYALAMTGLGEQEEHLQRLATALQEIDGQLSRVPGKEPKFSLPPLPVKACSAHRTHGLTISPVPPEQAVGEICASYIWAYPPGVPLIVPGEVMGQSLLHLLQKLEESGVDVQDTMDFWPKQIATFDGATT